MRQLDGARALVTGGAGFIGSHLVDHLLTMGATVTVLDNLSSGTLERLAHLEGCPDLNIVVGDLRDPTCLMELVPEADLVCHLAANGDIAAGVQYPERDINNGLQLTINVLDAMRCNNVRNLLFASSGSVYGERVWKQQSNESAGPLLPISIYAASKLAGEAFISSYSHLYGINSWIFRFGNVVGGRARRGVLYDLSRKLARDRSALDVLGDGHQEKPYLLVSECADAMLYAYRHAYLDPTHPCMTFNVAGPGTSVLSRIVSILLEEAGLNDVDVRYSGTQRGWPGDQTTVRLDVTRMTLLGWQSHCSSDEAVRIAARQILEEVPL